MRISSRPEDKSIIGTKWVFKNKLNENGNIIRNKVRLVAKGCFLEEDIDFEDSYAPVARLKAITILLVFTSHLNFMFIKWM